MNKSLGAVAASAALAITSLPSTATAAREVDGNRFPSSGLVRLVQGCNDPDAEPVEQPDFLVRRGPGNAPIGAYSSGWQVSGKEFGAGTLAPIDSPTTLTDFRISVNSPGGETVGTAVVRYHPPTDDGYWVGLSRLDTVSGKGWHTVGAAGRQFFWYHYSSTGTFDRIGPTDTVVGHTTSYGGDGEGAELGFLFGCNAEPFYVDRLQLESAEDDRGFDYGGFRTRAQLSLGTKEPDRITVTAGKRLALSGRLFQKYVGGRLAGPLRFQSKPARGGSWKTFGKKRTTRSDAALAGARPLRNIAYRVSYPGTAKRYENDLSNVLKVVVRMRASASFVDSTLIRGSGYAVVGRVKPGKRTGVALQRKVQGEWRTVRTGTTTSTGGYRLGGTAQTSGVSYWRVKVNGGAANADGFSRTIKLTVTDPPSDGGGGGGGGDGGGGGGGGGGNDDPPPPPEG